MASPPPPPRSTRSRPSLPPSGIPSTSTSTSSSSHPDGGTSPKSANAIAHAMYTQSLSGLGKKERGGGRKKSSGEATAEKMDLDTEAESTPTSKSTELESIPDAEVKDEEVDGSKSLQAAGGEQEEGPPDRPPPPSVVVTSEPQDDVDMEPAEHSVDGDNLQDDEDDDDDEGSDEGEADVTRCVCGITESDDMMIQCDTCNVWQHGACVGIPTEEETPDEYFCEKCRADLHIALKKWMRSTSRGRGGIFLPPSANDLHRLNPDDNVPPNQSKRWTHDLPNMPPITSGRESDSESDRGGQAARRSRSHRSKPASSSNAHPPAASTTAAASSSSSSAAHPTSNSHRPLAFPPRKTAPGSAVKGGSAAAGPSTATTTSSSSHPPPTPSSSSSSHPPLPKSHKRQVSSSSTHHGPTHRQLSPIPPSSSQSPPPTKLKSPKKRSTMNSRDAGLEEAIRESLLAAGGIPEDEKAGSSRRSVSSNGSSRDKDEHMERKSVAGSKRGRRMSMDSSVAGGDGAGEKAPPKKSKKAKKEVTLAIDPSIPTSPSHSRPLPSPSNPKGVVLDEHHPSHPHHGGKAKHPNQYTYRPKTSPSTAAFPPSAPSSHHGPAASSSSNAKHDVSPSKASKEKVSHASLSSAAHDHGTRRNAGPASASGNTNGHSNSNGGGGAHDHPASTNGNGKGKSTSTSHGGGGTHSHGHRGEGRAAARDRDRDRDLDASGGGGGGGGGGGTVLPPPTWGIPDHLSHLAHLLPTPTPQLLIVGINPLVPLPLPPNAESSTNPQVRRKPFSTGPREEQPTKVKWPAKRMTVGEMRKRVRGVLDFVGRWPVGEPVGEGEEEGEGRSEGAGASVDDSTTTPKKKSRAEEVEELVRDLISFEQRFGIAITSSSGSSSGLRSADLGGNLHAAAASVVEEEEDVAADAAAVEEAVEAVMEAAGEEVVAPEEGEGDVVMEEAALVVGEVEVASGSTVVLAA